MPEPYLDLERKLRPLADLLPRPWPGDWLAEHPEPGQTFAEYLATRPVRKDERLHTIYLCLLGDFSEAQRRFLDLTQDYLAPFALCLRRTLATASHELRHVLIIHHCTTFRCLLNGSNHQEKQDHRPLHLCPVCLRMVCWNLRTEPVPYLTNVLGNG